MIGVLSNGRLGNQMFQYAFIYAASKKNNNSFFIFRYNSLHYFKLHRDLQKNNKINILRFAVSNIFIKSSMTLGQRKSKNPVKWLINWAVFKNICDFPVTLDEDSHLLKNTPDNTLYDGFFQSEEYFIHLKEDIDALFEMKPKYQKEFWTKKKDLFNKKVIAVHIRRTDYLTCGNENLEGKNISLPITYYKKCLALIDDIADYNILFVSDDIDFVENEFGHKNNYFFENNSEIIDFQILLNADILIIANSTFSWWAAWLNKKASKIVYAPNYFLGFRLQTFYPAGIKVDTWQWIDVI